jgi:hypothetical protein
MPDRPLAVHRPPCAAGDANRLVANPYIYS